MAARAATAIPESPTTNGHASVPAGFVVQPRQEWLKIESGPYAGAEFRMWVNCPIARWREQFDPDPERRAQASAAIFLEHRAWGELDADGAFRPYPPCAEWAAFEAAIPQDLMNAMVDRAVEAMNARPNSPRPTAKP